MIFYKRYVARIQIATGHLTPCEFGVYDRLLDHYYAKEEPLPAELSRCCAIAGAQTKADRAAVATVLAEFFEQDEAGRWHQKTANEVIAEAQPKIAAARENGKKGGRPSKAKQAALASIQEPAGLFSGTQADPDGEARQRQRQIGSEANASAADAASDAVDNPASPKSAADMTKAELWAAGKSLLAAQGLPAAQCGSFVGALVKQYGDQVVVDAVRATVVAGPADAKEYLKATCMRAKGERKDPVTVASDAAEKTKAAHRADDALLAAQDPAVRAERIAAAKALLIAKKAEVPA